MSSKRLCGFLKHAGCVVALSLTLSGAANAFRLVSITTAPKPNQQHIDEFRYAEVGKYAIFDDKYGPETRSRLTANYEPGAFFNPSDGPDNGKASIGAWLQDLEPTPGAPSTYTEEGRSSLINIADQSSMPGSDLIRFGFNWGSGGSGFFDLLDANKKLVKRVYRNDNLKVESGGAFYSFDFDPKDYATIKYIDFKDTHVLDYNHLISPARADFRKLGPNGDPYTVFKNRKIATGAVATLQQGPSLLQGPSLQASEPGTAGILLAGLGLMGAGLHRRKKKKQQEKG